MDSSQRTGAWGLIKEDFATHLRHPLDPGFHALVVHRLGSAIAPDDRGVSRALRRLHQFAHRRITAAYGIEIPPSVRIGRRLSLPHAHGVVFVVGSVIGDDCVVRHNVTLGAASHEHGGYPTVGDRVHFGPGSIVTGEVKIGDDVRIGPGAVVITDVPAGSRVLAPVGSIRPPGPGSPPSPRDVVRPSADVTGDARAR